VPVCYVASRVVKSTDRPMTKFSDDGRWYWDGAQWLSAISADGAWKWTEAGWVANKALSTSRWPRIWHIGRWVGAGLAALLLLFCLIGLAVFISEESQGNPAALGVLGVVFVIVSFAVLLASPATLRLARRRGLFIGASITAAVLFLGSCGGGLALVAAYPTPSPKSVALEPTQTPSPLATQTPAPVAPVPTPSDVPSPSSSPSPSPSASPKPSPVLKPSPKPTPRRSPAPVVNLCGAPANPWHYNFCGRGSVIYRPNANFCTYFVPCVSTFWTKTSGYVVRCVSGKWSHSGGVSGACSSNGGVSRILYSGP